MTETPSQTTPDLSGADLAKLVADGFGDEVTPELAAQVLARLASLRSGDPVGTARRDPETGTTAVRVDRGIVHEWFLVKPNGEFWFDQSATLDNWPIIEERSADR